MFAVRKAVVTRQLRPGDKFPSVRVLSQELKVNPNTAHKVVAALVAEGVLVTTPAVGSIVAEREIGGKKERAELLGVEVEWLVVEAKKLGLGDVIAVCVAPPLVEHLYIARNSGLSRAAFLAAGIRRKRVLVHLA